MKIVLPKEQTSLVTPTVIPVELNDTDIDRMLTRILEMAVKRGLYASSRVDTKDYDKYLWALSESEHIAGIDGADGLDVLDGWIRASVLREERVGRRRDAVQMGYIRPLTIASYRSGLPKTANRNRRADTVTYQSVWRVLGGAEADTARVKKLFVDTFGAGVALGEMPWHAPAYDGTSNVDIDTLLALRFLEGFTGSQNPKDANRTFLPLAVPAAIDPLGHDLVAFLRQYGPAMPVAEAFTHVSALIALRLFQLPLVTARVVRSLLSGDTNDTPALEMYCDFVRRKGSPSDEVASLCVQRDLEILRTFFRDRLLIRELDRAAEAAGLNPPADDDPGERLRWAASLHNHEGINFGLGFSILPTIRGMQAEGSEEREFVEGVMNAQSLSNADKLAAILVEALRKRGLENQIKWFHNTGGIAKSYGMLSGTLRVRSTWRYAPSDEVLTTLLCLCFTDEDGTTTHAKLPVRDVLERLESRFGILIDRPPADFDSATARAGAQENFNAFTGRLKLLGCFQGLSDDFSAQYVTRPRDVVSTRENTP
ncbi:hypothetical protein QQX13_02495 [Demequina sp. SYSU T00068]|uniref:methylation-associated defense system protein MAD7 n=1 Tax=Demequina lignilytica TaxID=3051663 RepID=UPI00260DC998|nr:hypothetical protein [Demequina sp. SYSU T00068]MDN4489694.1 hypothetical protein [Demequina sp. SYSU T00068]